MNGTWHTQSVFWSWNVDKKNASRKLASPVPATKRMAALRDRRRKAGMTPMEVWAHPDDHQAIRDEAARLTKARDAAANA